jgi:hypothetical protein
MISRLGTVEVMRALMVEFYALILFEFESNILNHASKNKIDPNQYLS